MTINEFYSSYNDTLDLYTSAITKAHGQHHPEVWQVRSIYEEIQKKIHAGRYDLSDEFQQLRRITNNYAIPDDVCGAFRTAYQLLQQFDLISQN